MLTLLHPPLHAPAPLWPHDRFAPNTPVYFRLFTGRRRWEQGTILRRLGSHMFLVSTPTGLQRRHRNQLRLCHTSDSAASFPVADPQAASPQLLDGGRPSPTPPPQPSPLQEPMEVDMVLWAGPARPPALPSRDSVAASSSGSASSPSPGASPSRDRER